MSLTPHRASQLVRNFPMPLVQYVVLVTLFTFPCRTNNSTSPRGQIYVPQLSEFSRFKPLTAALQSACLPLPLQSSLCFFLLQYIPPPPLSHWYLPPPSPPLSLVLVSILALVLLHFRPPPPRLTFRLSPEPCSLRQGCTCWLPLEGEGGGGMG